MISGRPPIRRWSIRTKRKLRLIFDRPSRLPICPTTAFLRLAGTAGDTSVLRSSAEDLNAVANACTSARASEERIPGFGAVTMSARASAYRAAMAERVIALVTAGRRLSQIADELAHQSVLRVRGHSSPRDVFRQPNRQVRRVPLQFQPGRFARCGNLLPGMFLDPGDLGGRL